jgi:hypothetical protein
MNARGLLAFSAKKPLEVLDASSPLVRGVPFRAVPNPPSSFDPLRPFSRLKARHTGRVLLLAKMQRFEIRCRVILPN